MQKYIRASPCGPVIRLSNSQSRGKVVGSASVPKTGCRLGQFRWVQIKFTNGVSGWVADRGQIKQCSQRPTQKPTQKPAQKPVAKPSSSSAKVSGSFNCGNAFSAGRSLGSRQCVRINGKPVVISTAQVFMTMQAAARKAGVNIQVVSGFRTNSEQQYLYNCYVTKRCNNGNLAARPGYSNHQNGIALDLNTSSGGVYNWLRTNGSKFGFIRTVPSEIWHWEYRPNQRCNSKVSYSCN